MKRGSPMRRTAFKAHRPKTKAAPFLIPKNLGKSAKGYKKVDKAFAHMGKIADLACLICSRPAVVHHVDILMAKGMGPKVTGYLTAPLCPDHHVFNVHDSAHGYGGERAFWYRHGIDIGWWILHILRDWYPSPDEHVAAAIAAIEKQRRISNG